MIRRRPFSAAFESVDPRAAGPFVFYKSEAGLVHLHSRQVNEPPEFLFHFTRNAEGILRTGAIQGTKYVSLTENPSLMRGNVVIILRSQALLDAGLDLWPCIESPNDIIEAEWDAVPGRSPLQRLKMLEDYQQFPPNNNCVVPRASGGYRHQVSIPLSCVVQIGYIGKAERQREVFRLAQQQGIPMREYDYREWWTPNAV